MKKQLQRKHILWLAGIPAVILVAAVSWYFLSGNNKTERGPWYKGDPSKIEKSEKRKEQFVVGVSDVPETSSPLRESGSTANKITSLVYEPLLSVNKEGEAAYRLAKSIKFSSDGTSARVTLKKAVFSDGTALTADTVIRAYEYLGAADSSYENKDGLLIIEGMAQYQNGENKTIYGIEKKSGKELEFTFTSAAVQNLRVFQAPIAIPSDEKHPYALGTGPYAVKSIQSLSEAVLEKNKKADNTYPYKEVRFLNLPLEQLKKSIKEYGVDLFEAGQEDGISRMKKAGYFDIYREKGEETAWLFLSSEMEKDARQAVFDGFDSEKFVKDSRRVGMTAASSVKAEKKAGKEYTVRILTQNDAVSMSEAALLEKQFKKLGFKTEIKGAGTDEFIGLIEQETDFDCYYNRSPIGAERLLDVYSMQKKEDKQFQKELVKQMSEDSTQVYKWIMEQMEEEKLFLPVMTREKYVAAAADCRDVEWLQNFINE